MKKLLFFLLLSTMAAGPAMAQQQVNLGSFALHGPVKVLKVKDGRIEKGDTSFSIDDEISFDRAGKVQRIVHHHPFSAASEDYQYDPQGRLQSIAKYTAAGKPYDTWVYNYTGDDSTYTITATNPALGFINQRQRFNHGKMVSLERYYYPDTVKNDWFTSTYDEHGRLTSEVVYYHRKPSYHNTYKYNGGGRDNTDSFYDKNDKLDFTEQRYYDPQGRIIHRLARFPDGRLLKEVFTTYDARGYEINTREVDGVSNLNWDKTYEYDRYGNWTKRQVHSTKGKYAEVLTFRTISYY